MPLRAKHVCNHPGCHKLTRVRYCDDHDDDSRKYDQERGSAAARGYGARWQKRRTSYLAEYPLCVQCLAAGRTTASVQVDHIVPISGADDPKFWDESNWQALCTPCHRAKSAREKCYPQRY